MLDQPRLGRLQNLTRHLLLAARKAMIKARLLKARPFRQHGQGRAFIADIPEHTAEAVQQFPIVN